MRFEESWSWCWPCSVIAASVIVAEASVVVAVVLPSVCVRAEVSVVAADGEIRRL